MKISNRIKLKTCKIKIIDKYLVVIMMILIVYSIFAVLFSNAGTDFSEKIDVVIRTTIASIFGYFISSNFIRNESDENGVPFFKSSPPISSNNPTSSPTITNKIGFTMDESPNSSSSQGQQKSGAITSIDIKQASNASPSASQLQIEIVGTLCICLILVLIYVRFFVDIKSSQLPALFQFRDIICSSIGFLIGIPSSNKA